MTIFVYIFWTISSIVISLSIASLIIHLINRAIFDFFVVKRARQFPFLFQFPNIKLHHVLFLSNQNFQLISFLSQLTFNIHYISMYFMTSCSNITKLFKFTLHFKFQIIRTTPITSKCLPHFTVLFNISDFFKFSPQFLTKMTLIFTMTTITHAHLTNKCFTKIVNSNKHCE